MAYWPRDATPYLIDIIPWFTPIASVGTWSFGTDTSSMVGGYMRNSTNAQNNEISWDVMIPAGTWTLEWFTATNVDAAIITASLSVTGALGTVDGYSASTVYNVKQSITGVVVASTAVQRLTFKAATRHASSTGWFIRLVALQLRRTA